MFRFIWVLALMALSFMMGKMSAQPSADFTVVYEMPALENKAADQEIAILISNQFFKKQYPELYRELLVFLAVPAVQNALLDADRANSRIYQKLSALLAEINVR